MPNVPDKNYPQAESQADLARNLAEVQRRIQAACEKVGRAAAEVRLLPVSKTVDAERLRLAYAAGCRELGENKVQEAHRKWQQLGDLTDLRWSVIGHLQTNKAKVVAQFASEFQALDSLRVAEHLDRHLQAAGRSLPVFVQVNTSGEPSKYGLPPSEALAFIQQLPAFSSLQIVGLMTLAAFTTDQARVRNCFQILHDLRHRCQQELPDGDRVQELSMGMSGDYELAVTEGATVVRVGQAIFGARSTPDAYYWPSQG